MPVSVDEFTTMEKIVIDKKTKSGIKDTDIRPDIVSIKLCGGYMDMTLSAGSDKNLKPDVVVKAMNRYINGYGSGDCEYERIAIYDESMNEII